MGKAMPIRLLVSILSSIKYMVMLALSHTGLVDPPEDAIYTGEVTITASPNNKDYVMMADGPTQVPVPIPIITAFIKRRLPILRYADCKQLLTRTCCVVCWDGIEANEEIRELCNCEHVFHRVCLDRWVDEGHSTCPLCRSMLFPLHTNPWMLLSTANQLLEQEEATAAFSQSHG